jgi:ABC-2 type transport system permease protein
VIPYTATLRSEWTKLTSLRSVRVMTTLAVLLSVALTAALAAAVGHAARGWTAADTAAFEPISFSMVGTLVTVVFFAVIGVTAATAEYTSGMARVTFAATPRRWRVVTAKLLSVGALTLVTGTIAVVAMFLAGQAVLSSYGAPHASLGDGAAFRTVAGTAMVGPVLPLFAAGLGLALRSTAGALVSLLVLAFGPPAVGALLPTGWQRPLRYLPDAASDAITNGHLPDASAGLWPGTAALVLVGWVALFVVAAAALVERRDA